MANEAQVAILKQGVAVWNQWRQDNPDAVIDLSEIDLSIVTNIGAALWNSQIQRADLTKAELRGADLTKATFGGAILWEANLTQANLTQANLTQANLTQADLAYADLRKADLTNADLTEARLRRTNLTNATLRGADLTKAYLELADLTKADLTKADLYWADLTNAYLDEADLTEARLTKADLWGTSLCKADLTKAKLWKANLTKADLTEADLMGADLTDTDLWSANLTEADLRNADLREADLRHANLTKAVLEGVRLNKANLTNANLTKSHLSNTDLTDADLTEANLGDAKLVECDLTRARFVETHLEGATLSDCRIYGLSAWNVFTDENTVQTNLFITPHSQPDITVDNLKVAQFLYLIINNKEIRNVIDTIRSKVVLILGRFDDNNKPRLNRLREALSGFRDEKGEQRYIPVMFDFDKPGSTNFMEPVVTLAHMSRFIIADFTDPRVVLTELQAIYGPAKIPLLPLLRQREGEQVLEPIPLPDIRYNNRWIMPTQRYANDDELLDQVGTLIARAEKHRRRVEKEIERSNRENDDDDEI